MPNIPDSGLFVQTRSADFKEYPQSEQSIRRPETYIQKTSPSQSKHDQSKSVQSRETSSQPCAGSSL